MIPDIHLIAGTAVHWQRFVTATNAALGRSPTRSLDEYELPVGNPSSYVAALAEFARPGSNPLTSVRDGDRLFNHLFFTFLVGVDAGTAMSVLKVSTGLIVTSAEPSRGRENLIVSGTLKAWKDAIVESCVPGTDPDVRRFYNDVWAVFDRLGFRDVFARYQRREQKDNTFVLETRK